MSVSSTKRGSASVRLSDRVVPVAERAVQALHRLMDPTRLILHPGLRHAAILKDQVLVFIDYGPNHQALVRLVREPCSDLQVGYQIVPVAGDLCFSGQEDYIQKVSQKLLAIRERLRVALPVLAFLTDHHFFIGSYHEQPLLSAGMIIPYASRRPSATQATTLLKRLADEARLPLKRGLRFLINGHWVDARPGEGFEDVITRAPEAFTPQLLPKLSGQLAHFLQGMATRLRKAGENKVTSTVPTWFSLDCQNRPVIDWEAVVSALPVGELSRRVTRSEAEQSLCMAHSLQLIVEQLRAASSNKRTGVLPYGFNFDAEGKLVVNPEALFRGF